ncbi:MAG: GreA/GreB family elongation factor [Bdellovibrionota bacterium]
MKSAVVAAVLATLKKDLAQLRISAEAAHDAATNEENKPENQYDTRALEASYLADAQKQRVAALERAVKALSENANFGHFDSVNPGSLVEVTSDGHSRWFFLLHSAAGVVVEVAGKKISVLGHESPVGQALLGKKVGDVVEVRGPGGTKEYEIVSLE